MKTKTTFKPCSFPICIIITIICFLHNKEISSQSTFQKVIGSGSEGFPSHGIQTSDDGFIMCGNSGYGTGAGWGDMFLLKTDNNGVTQWYKTYGSNKRDFGNDVRQTSDGGYIMVGYSEGFGTGYNYDIYLVKTDAAGTELWAKRYDTGQNDEGRVVRQTSDGGYVIAGSTDAPDFAMNGATGEYLIKTDSIGNIEWTKAYGEAFKYSKLQNVIQTNDGGYIMVGGGGNFGGSLQIIKVNSTGTAQWSKLLNMGNYDQRKGIEQTSDGGYIISGNSQGGAWGSSCSFLLKITSSGSTEWLKFFDGDYDEAAHSVNQTSDGGYIMAGWSNNGFNTNLGQSFLIKTDGNGTLQWCKLYGANSTGAMFGQPSSDGGYVLGGTINIGSNRIHLVKTDAMGNTTGCPASVVNPLTPNLNPATSTGVKNGSGGTADTVTSTINSYSLTDSVLCTTTSSLTANFSADTVCQGSPTSFTNFSTGATSWNWNFGDPPSGSSNNSSLQNPTHIFSGSGNFIVSLNVSDGTNNTSITKSITVLPLNTVNKNLNICYGDSVLIGGVWQKTSGTYNDTIDNAAGCDSVVITNLTVDSSIIFNLQVSLCNGDSAFAAGNWQKTQGIYYDTIPSSGGCDSIKITTIFIDSATTTTKTFSLCNGDSIFLQGSWQKNPGTFYDTLIKSNGCDSIIKSNLSFIAPTAASVSGTSEICKGENATLVAFGGDSYSWSNGSPDDTITPSPAFSTKYFVTITNNCGTFKDSFSVSVNSPPFIFIGNDTTVGTGATLQLQASTGTTFLWSTGENTSEILISPSETSIYIVTVTDAKGCSATDSIIIIVDSRCTYYMPTIFTPNGDGTNDNLVFTGSGIKSMKLLIFDRWGEKVFEYAGTSIPPPVWEGKVKNNGKIMNTAAFVYILEITCINGEIKKEKGNITLVK